MHESPTEQADLAEKIKRLAYERGFNLAQFARSSRLNRHTVRQIFDGERRLRASTVLGCANALGLTVNELRTLPLEKLLPRMVEGAAGGTHDLLRRTYDQATQPELRLWMERNPDRARQLSEDELDELLAMQGDDGPLSAFGVEACVVRIERRRRLWQQINTIAGTEYLDTLEKLVGLMYDKVRPRSDEA